MPRGKKVKSEQIIRLLRDAEVAMAEGMKAVESFNQYKKFLSLAQRVWCYAC